MVGEGRRTRVSMPEQPRPSRYPKLDRVPPTPPESLSNLSAPTPIHRSDRPERTTSSKTWRRTLSSSPSPHPASPSAPSADSSQSDQDDATLRGRERDEPEQKAAWGRSRRCRGSALGSPRPRIGRREVWGSDIRPEAQTRPCRADSDRQSLLLNK